MIQNILNCTSFIVYSYSSLQLYQHSLGTGYLPNTATTFQKYGFDRPFHSTKPINVVYLQGSFFFRALLRIPMFVSWRVHEIKGSDLLASSVFESSQDTTSYNLVTEACVNCGQLQRMMNGWSMVVSDFIYTGEFKKYG